MGAAVLYSALPVHAVVAGSLLSLLPTSVEITRLWRLESVTLLPGRVGRETDSSQQRLTSDCENTEK